jgi:hypothetical protein
MILLLLAYQSLFNETTVLGRFYLFAYSFIIFASKGTEFVIY